MRVLHYFCVVTIICVLPINFSEVLAMQRQEQPCSESPKPLTMDPSCSDGKIAFEILTAGRIVIRTHGANAPLAQACDILEHRILNDMSESRQQDIAQAAHEVQDIICKYACEKKTHTYNGMPFRL